MRYRNPSFFFASFPADLERRKADGGIDQQLRRVISRLAVDVDGPREVGRAIVIEPVVVGEPGAWFGDDNEIAAAIVRDSIRNLLRPVEHPLDSRRLLEECAHGRRLRRVIDVDVRNLMVGHRKRGAGAGVEELAAELLSNGQQAVLAKDTIEVDGPGHVGESVLRDAR